LKCRFFVLPLFFCSFWIISGSAAPVSDTPRQYDTGTVVVVYDGDTIQVQFADASSQRIRLLGIDTPEIDDPREDVAFWAFLARRFSFFYLYRHKVHLTYDQTRVDKYGRTLAYVWTDQEKLFNEFIIREGFAYAFLVFPFRSDRQDLFREAQQEARREKRGLWMEKDPDTISAAVARSRLGEYISVRFKCSSAEEGGSFIYLASGTGEFEALIPRNRAAAFPELEKSIGRILVVSGFLEEYQGRPQIVVFFPGQLRPATGRE
jgi:micrococcal nuclease